MNRKLSQAGSKRSTSVSGRPGPSEPSGLLDLPEKQFDFTFPDGSKIAIFGLPFSSWSEVPAGLVVAMLMDCWGAQAALDSLLSEVSYGTIGLDVTVAASFSPSKPTLAYVRIAPNTA